jgi:hypothetical protein
MIHSKTLLFNPKGKQDLLILKRILVMVNLNKSKRDQLK